MLSVSIIKSVWELGVYFNQILKLLRALFLVDERTRSLGQNVTVSSVVRTRSSLLYRAKTRTETVSGRGGSQRSEGAEKERGRKGMKNGIEQREEDKNRGRIMQ